MQNQECADQIFDLLNNNCLLEQLSFNCQMRKYSNKEEVKKYIVYWKRVIVWVKGRNGAKQL